MRVLQPLLAKHTTLWGIGVTKDIFDVSASNGITKVPQIEVQSTPKLGCLDCGQVADLSPEQQMNPGAPMPTGQGQAPCPSCNGMNTMGWQEDQPIVTQVKQFANGKLCTEVRPIFEFFVPRDCQNPNLAKKLQQRYRKPIGEVKRMWKDRKDEIKADDKQETHEIYLEALRSLVNYNYMHDQTNDGMTITETWVDFDQLPEQLQKLLITECGGDPNADDDDAADDDELRLAQAAELDGDAMQLAGDLIGQDERTKAARRRMTRTGRDLAGVPGRRVRSSRAAEALGHFHCCRRRAGPGLGREQLRRQKGSDVLDVGSRSCERLSEGPGI
jgi:hypothetical protein